MGFAVVAVVFLFLDEFNVFAKVFHDFAPSVGILPTIYSEPNLLKSVCQSLFSRDELASRYPCHCLFQGSVLNLKMGPVTVGVLICPVEQDVALGNALLEGFITGVVVVSEGDSYRFEFACHLSPSFCWHLANHL